MTSRHSQLVLIAFILQSQLQSPDPMHLGYHPLILLPIPHWLIYLILVPLLIQPIPLRYLHVLKPAFDYINYLCPAPTAFIPHIPQQPLQIPYFTTDFIWNGLFESKPPSITAVFNAYAFKFVEGGLYIVDQGLAFDTRGRGEGEVFQQSALQVGFIRMGEELVVGEQELLLQLSTCFLQGPEFILEYFHIIAMDLAQGEREDLYLQMQSISPFLFLCDSVLLLCDPFVQLIQECTIEIALPMHIFLKGSCIFCIQGYIGTARMLVLAHDIEFDLELGCA
ncbi:hypothetical protein FGO68_gene17561 [Halteria grandinella]|uniref:Uncharacterized protein n=1 Tax=Halteria grandinella TaxID=5974 RepID=A0A8J8NJD1_HALGN|nr:hypothetical protein FGO68_gene17561 [Halteria grandinella]